MVGRDSNIAGQIKPGFEKDSFRQDVKPGWEDVAKGYYKTTSHLARRIKSRVRKYNKNFICCFVGDTGSGKSYAAMQLALSCDPTFYIVPRLDSYDRLVFGEMADQFMRIINAEGKGLLKTSQAILWDEIGRGLPKKEWYDVVNRSINKLMQSFRWKRLIVIMTVPDKSYIDKDTTKLFHMIFEMTDIDFIKKESIAKAKEVQVNRLSGDSYFKYPRMRDRKGRVYVLNPIYFRLPPQKVLDLYERKKRIWAKMSDMDLQMEIITKKNKRKGKNLDLRTMVEYITKNHEDFTRSKYKKGGRMIDYTKVMMKFGIGEALARSVKTASENDLKEKKIWK